MPNWCSNRLEVYGVAADRAEFATRTSGTLDYYTFDGRDTAETAFCLGALVPLPDERFRGSNDAEWETKLWGVDREVRPDDVKVQHGAGCITYEFATAWGPPLIWLATVARRFSHLQFRFAYEEPNMVFAGLVLFSGGEIVEQYATQRLDRYREFLRAEFGYDWFEGMDDDDEIEGEGDDLE